jgi:hypothetical protein
MHVFHSQSLLVDRFDFFRDFSPLVDEIQIDQAETRIWASERTMLTLHRLLSTVFGPS